MIISKIDKLSYGDIDRIVKVIKSIEKYDCCAHLFLQILLVLSCILPSYLFFSSNCKVQFLQHICFIIPKGNIPEFNSSMHRPASFHFLI